MPKPKNPEFIKVKNSSEEYRPSRIFCVGANYRKHVAEMGLPGREKPFFFMKLSASIASVGLSRKSNLYILKPVKNHFLCEAFRLTK